MYSQTKEEKKNLIYFYEMYNWMNYNKIFEKKWNCILYVYASGKKITLFNFHCNFPHFPIFT